MPGGADHEKPTGRQAPRRIRRGFDLSLIDARATQQGIGREAEHPGQIPWRGWKSVIRRTFREMTSDRVSLVAAGCAFYGTLALFPTITMLISIYGLLLNPTGVEQQLAQIAEIVPHPVYALIADRVHDLARQPRQTLGIGLVFSAGVAFWSSATGTKAILSALNLAYGETEQRGFLRFQLIGLLITLGAIVSVAVALALLVALPTALAFIGLSAYTRTLLRVASFGTLVLFLLLSLSLLYRVGPCRRRARWHWVTPGSLIATVLWFAASVLFSVYVGHIARFNVTYGPLGAVVGVMLWFFVTAYAVLLGAELNAELELQTTRDSTEGEPKPPGERGAYVADNVAED